MLLCPLHVCITSMCRYQGSKTITVLSARGITVMTTDSNHAYISVQGKYREMQLNEILLAYYLHTKQMHKSTKNSTVITQIMKDKILSGDI